MSEGKLGTEEKGLDIKQTYELTYLFSRSWKKQKLP